VKFNLEAKWKKVMVFGVPLLIGGTVVAMASGDGVQERRTSTPSSNVSVEVVSTEPLTADELKALAEAEPAPVETAANPSEPTIDQGVLDKTNPFLVTAAMPAPAPAGSSFDLSNVGKLELETNTTQGELKLAFEGEGGMKLEGEFGERKVEVKGEQAVAVLTQLLAAYHLNDALTAALQGRQVQLDPNVLASIRELKVELKDGRKIQGKTDNGKHKGWEKNGKSKDDDGGDGKNKDKGKQKED